MILSAPNETISFSTKQVRGDFNRKRTRLISIFNISEMVTLHVCQDVILRKQVILLKCDKDQQRFSKTNKLIVDMV